MQILDFADDLALLCHTQGALQDMTNRLHVFGKKVGLHISGEKTKAMTVGDHATPPVTLDGQNMEKVNKFQYLEAIYLRTEMLKWTYGQDWVKLRLYFNNYGPFRSAEQ